MSLVYDPGEMRPAGPGHRRGLVGDPGPTPMDPDNPKFWREDADWAQIDWADLSGVPATFPPAAHEHDGSDINTGTIEIPVAFSPAIADHAYSGIVAVLTAGENLALGDIAYFKSDGKLWKAKADANATMPCIFLVVVAANANDPVTVLLRGFFRDDSAYNWTVGGQASAAAGLLYVSEATGGAITQTRPSASGNIVQILGFAYSADIIYFDPDKTFVEIA